MMMHQSSLGGVMLKDWFAIFKVMVTVRDHIIMTISKEFIEVLNQIKCKQNGHTLTERKTVT